MPPIESFRLQNAGADVTQWMRITIFIHIRYTFELTFSRRVLNYSFFPLVLAFNNYHVPSRNLAFKAPHWLKIIVIHLLYYVVPNPHELWNKDAKRKDTFELDLQNRRLINK